MFAVSLYGVGLSIIQQGLLFYHYGMIILGKTYHGRTERAAKEYQASIFGGKFSVCLFVMKNLFQNFEWAITA